MVNRVLIVIVATILIFKITAIFSTNFDLFGDEAQYWLWSKNLDFGYFSKPPLLAWVIAGFTSLFGDNFISLKTLPVLVYFFTTWALYSLCKNIGLKKLDCISCSLIFSFIPAVSFSSFVISTDILLLLFWTLALNELVKIKKSLDLKNFIYLGIFVGLAFLSKYAAIYFIVCFFIYVLLDKSFRFLFIKNYYLFSLSFVCAFLILLPNIIWNINNGWVTLQHTSDNANLENTDISFYRGVEFLIIQIFMVGPFLFVAFFLNMKKITYNNNQKLLLTFSLPIFLIVFIEALVVRANANWAAPALISFYVFLYIGANSLLFRFINIAFNLIFCLVLFLLIGTSYQTKIFDRINGINNFSENLYYNAANKNIDSFVISDRLLFASMNYELKNKEMNFYMPYKISSKVTNHFALSSPLKKNISENFILVGSPDQISYLEKKFNLIEIITPSYKFTKKDLKVYEVLFD